MKTYIYKDNDGKTIAFEVSNTWLSRRRAVKIVENLDAVKILKRPIWFSFKNQDVFCEFKYKGNVYIIEEPWGDSSRYWIGPKEEGNSNALNEILECFKNA